MTIQYTSLPDWAGEAANRKRLEAWHDGFGPGGIPCPVCELRKVREDLRRLTQHLAAGKETVTVVAPAAGAPPREWAVSLLASPAAVIDGRPSQNLELLDLRLTCTRCATVLTFDARRIGLAV
jgi:hypothetical protein